MKRSKNSDQLGLQSGLGLIIFLGILVYNAPIKEVSR